MGLDTFTLGGDESEILRDPPQRGERDELTSLVETGREAAYRRRNARILLLADQGEHGPGQPDTEIVEQVGVTRQTVEKVRKRCVQDGLKRLRWYAAGGAASGLRCWMARERSRLDAIACSEPPSRAGAVDPAYAVR